MISSLHICASQKKLMSRFPVEAGHFSDKERVIPKCPIKKTLFGFRQVFTDDGSFNEALNSYIKVNRIMNAAHYVILLDQFLLRNILLFQEK